jgi:thiol-disulfide isomerase/thioredoxin
MWHKQEPTARGELDDEPAEEAESTRGAWAICMFAIPTAAIAGFAAFYMNICDPSTESGHNSLIGDVICAADPSSSHKVVERRGRVRVAGEIGQMANPAGPVPEGLMKYARGSLSKLLVLREPRAVADDASFSNARGERHALADWKGKVVLLNIWATWCSPCKLEMPSLDRLQARMGGPDFTVLAVSVNRDGVGKPQTFFQENKIASLEVLNDETSQFTSKMKAGGLPATLLLDREGREIARVLGPAEWDSEEALALIREAVGR